MSINTLRGFFYISGGIDRPIGYNDNLNFGFDPIQLGSGPIFNYSINSVKKFFNEPIAISRLTNDQHTINVDNILCMIIDGFDGTNDTDYTNISDADFTAKKLQEVFNILEYLNNNQTIIMNPSIDHPTTYSCIGDECASGISNSYIRGSLIITNSSYCFYGSTKTTPKVAKVSFQLLFGTNPDNSPITQEFVFYFTPDDMYLCNDLYTNDNGGTNFGRYAIVEDIYQFTYFDPNDPDPFQPFKNTPLVRISSVENNGDYTNFVTFITTHVIYDNNYQNIINTISQQFFILNNLYSGYQIPIYRQIIAVKSYLINEYNSDFSLLMKIYPDLFANSSIDIYPLLNNTVDNNNTQIDKIAANGIVTPFRLMDVTSELTRRGVITSGFNGSTNIVDMFIIEGVSEFDSNDIFSDDPRNLAFRIPLIAVDNSIIPSNSPIASKYPDFMIKTAGMEYIGKDWETFQFFLKLFLRVLLKMNQGNFANLTDEQLVANLNIPLNFALKTTRYPKDDPSLNEPSLFGVNYIETITFTFNGVNYTVHGYNYEVIYGTV